jgi:hypothetical protein
VLTPAAAKRSNAGRKRIDVIVMFQMLGAALYNFSDKQAEYHGYDLHAVSAARFLGQDSACHDAVDVP